MNEICAVAWETSSDFLVIAYKDHEPPTKLKAEESYPRDEFNYIIWIIIVYSFLFGCSFYILTLTICWSIIWKLVIFTLDDSLTSQHLYNTSCDSISKISEASNSKLEPQDINNLPSDGAIECGLLERNKISNAEENGIYLLSSDIKNGFGDECQLSASASNNYIQDLFINDEANSPDIQYIILNKTRSSDSISSTEYFSDVENTSTGSILAKSSYISEEIISDIKEPVINKALSQLTTENIESPLPSKSQIVYTDGSCIGNGQFYARAGYGLFYGHGDSRNVSRGVSGLQCSFNAELLAVEHALLNGINDANRGIITYLQILTDCMPVIDCIMGYNGMYSKYRPIINSCKSKVERLRNHGIEVDIEYVRGHSGNYGNEQADRLAKLGAGYNFDR